MRVRYSARPLSKEHNLNLRSLRQLFTIFLILIWGVTAAAHCEDDLSGDGSSKSDIIEFHLRSLKMNQIFQHRSHNDQSIVSIIAAMDWLNGFIHQHVDDHRLEELSHYDVWSIHESFSRLPLIEDYIIHSPDKFSLKSVAQFIAHYTSLEDTATETGFFEELTKLGHSLRPAAHRIVKIPLPYRFSSFLSFLDFHSTITRAMLTHLARRDRIYSASLLRRTLNGGTRAYVFDVLGQYLEGLNNTLSELRIQVDVPSTDVSPVLLRIQKTRDLLAQQELQRALHFGRQSPFRKTRRRVRAITGMIHRFETLADWYQHLND